MIKFPLLTPYDISENRFPLYQHLKNLLFVKKLLPSTVQTSCLGGAANQNKSGLGQPQGY